MSDAIEHAFAQSRVEFGLKQKPNWAGVVYGACQKKGCSNFKKIGYYIGGFCKICSIRHPLDYQKDVISTIIRESDSVDIPNPRVRWIEKSWVKDLSHLMTPKQREDFYMTPEERRKRLDSGELVDKDDEEEDEESIIEKFDIEKYAYLEEEP